MSQKIKTSVEIDGSLTASQIANATTDTDKFLVSDGGTVKYRTGAELAADLGISAGTTSKVQHQVKAGVAINKGQAVYVTSADGTNMIVGLASNASEATSSKTMGLLNATVAANGFADVITEGLLDGLNTIGANAGDPVWLGTGGNLIYGLVNKPYAPNHLVFIGIVTRVNANNGEIFVKVQNGFELDEIHDVDLKTTAKINGHILGYDGSLWVNKTVAGWLGYTPYNASNPAGYISSYTETDTLASVTGRGNTTTSNISANGVRIGRNFSLANRATVRLDSNGDYPADVLFGRDVNYADSSWNGVYWSLSSRGSNESNSFRLYRGIANTGTTELVVLDVNTSGSVTASGDFRAPIFYDSNDTSYYTNPASTSNLYGLTVNQTISGSVSGSAANLNGSINLSTSGISSMKVNDTRYWVNDPNAPGNYFQALTLGNGSDFTQIGVNSSQVMSFRFNGSSNIWNTVLSSNNYSSYAVPLTRTITINGTSYDLSANRSWTVTGTETDTLATVTGRGASTSTLSNFNGGLTATKTAKNAYAMQLKGGLYGAPRLQLYDLAVDSNAFVGIGVDMSTGSYEFSNYFPRYNGNGRWSVGSWAGDFGTGQYVSGYNEKLWVNESGAQFNVSLTDTVDMRAPIFYDSNNTAYYGDFAGTSRINSAQADYIGVGQAINTGYRIIADGSMYLNSNGNGWAEGVWKQRRGGSTFYDVLDTGNIYSYSPTLTGGNASGTWGINISGTANVANTATDLNAADSTQINFNSVTNTDYSTMTFMSRAWADVQGANGLAYRFNTHTNAGSGGWEALRIYYGESGYVSTQTSFRSPIFYDSDNTAYYVNPAATSSIVGLQVYGTLNVYGSNAQFWTATGGGYQRVDARDDSTGARAHWYGVLNNGATSNFRHAWYDGTAYFGVTAESAFINFTRSGGGNITTDGSFRSPIFYDLNDTSYYADFNSTSNEAIRVRGGAYHGPNPTWGAYLLVGGDGRNGYMNNTLVASVCATDGNLHMDAASGKNMYLNYYDGATIYIGNGAESIIGTISNSGYFQISDSFRAPVFYDSNNTGYYGDFASSGTSLSINGGIVTTAPSGSILLKHEVAEANAWLFRENAPNWGLYWFNTGTQSGQVIGSYTTIGAELFGTNNAVGGFNPNSAWTGTNADTRMSWMLSNYTGYIWSNSTMYAAGDMRAPIFYDANDTGYYWNPATDTSHRFQTPSGYIDIGPKNGGYCHIYTDRPSFYFNAQLEVLGNRVLNAGNYTSYSPTLSGTGATGTWPISISGNAATASGVDWYNVSGKPAGWLNSSVLIEEMAPSASAFPSGFYQNYAGSGNPTGTWMNYINVRHSNSGNGHGFQLGMSYYDNNLWFRSYQGGLNPTFQGWQRAAVARSEGTNYVDYSRYVYNNGAYSGSGWVEPSDLGVRYANSAGSASSASYASYLPTAYNGGVLSNPQSYFNNGIGLKVAMTGAWSVWSDTLWINGYSGGDVSNMCALHFLRNGTPRMSISTQGFGASSYGTFYEVYSSYNMDAPNKSGTSYYQTNTWMQFNGSYGLYWPSNYGAHLHANDLSSYTQLALRGNKNGYGGFYDQHSAVNGFMYDSAGNGGIYREANGRWYLYHHVGNNCTAISTSTTSSSYRAYVGGSLYAEGDIVAYSDRRKKENIATVDGALDKVNKLRGVYYNRIDDDTKKRQVGVIAQEIQEILPEVVTYAEDVDEYGVSYGNITGLLIEAIKEQQTQIEELKELVKTLINK